MSCYLISAIDESPSVSVLDQVKTDLSLADLQKSDEKSEEKIGEFLFSKNIN